MQEYTEYFEDYNLSLTQRLGHRLFTCSRGYGTSMAQELLETGAEYGLRSAGEMVFSECL